MKNNIKTKYIIILVFLLITNFITYAQIISNSSTNNQHYIKLGAYYFDGWTGSTNHITQGSRHDFPERMPRGGWLTSTPRSMVLQINEAAKSGISFFSFCWYYVNSDSTIFKAHPLNRAVGLFINAPNSNKLEFNLLIANHEGSIIRPADWEVVTSTWITYFKNPNYLKVENKPMITFFNLKGLLKEFGSVTLVKNALERLRSKAILEGLDGVQVAACVSNASTDAALAVQCGFDILTAYNNHSAGFNVTAGCTIPIDSLRTETVKLWDTFKTHKLPYIPAVTLNWDPRPWVSLNPKLATSKRYVGYSCKSVFSMVASLKNWIIMNPKHLTKDRIAILYAWNEYGEGAWLTPSKILKNSLLLGVKRGIKKQINEDSHYWYKRNP